MRARPWPQCVPFGHPPPTTRPTPTPNAADAPLLGSSIVDLFESRAATLGALRLYTWLRTDGSEEASLSYE